MASTRLSTVIGTGDLVIPQGTVRVLRPPQDMDLSLVAPNEVEVSHGFAPDHALWMQRGYPNAGQGKVSTVIVSVPRAKRFAQSLILQAIDQAEELVIIDGQKTDGIDSIYKFCRDWADIQGMITKNHGRLFWFTPKAKPDWVVERLSVDGLITAPGVFSEDRVDPGSLILTQALPPLRGHVADLGAGWGYLSRNILRNDDVTHLDMIEAERSAVDCLNTNITDPRANAHWADATTWQKNGYDTVVMNPPFHTGRKGDPDIGRAFIDTAAKILKPSGDLFLVANRHLPYEGILSERFINVSEIGGDPRFKVIHANRPRKSPTSNSRAKRSKA